MRYCLSPSSVCLRERPERTLERGKALRKHEYFVPLSRGPFLYSGLYLESWPPPMTKNPLKSRPAISADEKERERGGRGDGEERGE